MSAANWNWATDGDDYFVESSTATIAKMSKRSTRNELFLITAAPQLLAAVNAARALLTNPEADEADATRVLQLLEQAVNKAAGGRQ